MKEQIRLEHLISTDPHATDGTRECLSITAVVCMLPSSLGLVQALLAEAVATFQLKGPLVQVVANGTFDIIPLVRVHGIQRPIDRHGEVMGKANSKGLEQRNDSRER